ncbi:MAG: hypothetical protein ACYSUI_17365, partial [Planctomycetota bacterium]
MRRVLMISVTFPPYNLSGSQRAFQFAKYLPEYGYLPSVVSVEPKSTDSVDPSQLEQLDRRIRLERVRELGPKIALLLRTLQTMLQRVTGPMRTAGAETGDALNPEVAPTPESTDSDDPTFPSESVPLLMRLWKTLAWVFHYHLDIGAPLLQRAVKIGWRDSV